MLSLLQTDERRRKLRTNLKSTQFKSSEYGCIQINDVCNELTEYPVNNQYNAGFEKYIYLTIENETGRPEVYIKRSRGQQYNPQRITGRKCVDVKTGRKDVESS